MPIEVKMKFSGNRKEMRTYSRSEKGLTLEMTGHENQARFGQVELRTKASSGGK